MSKILNGKLNCSDGSILTYRRLLPKKSTARHAKKLGVMFLGGYLSNMMGSKASYLEAFCEEQGLAYVRFDYYAHGSSPGEMHESTIGRWKENSLCVLDELTGGPQILIGSSMGGWLMFLIALLRVDRIKGLIGIAPATDFVDHLLNLTDAHKKQLETHGVCYIQHKKTGYSFPLLKTFVEDAKKNRVLTDKHKKLKEIPIKCPVRILHGMHDDQVPWQHSIKLIESLKNDAQLILIKEGNHRLSRPEDLQLLSNTLINLINQI